MHLSISTTTCPVSLWPQAIAKVNKSTWRIYRWCAGSSYPTWPQQVQAEYVRNWACAILTLLYFPGNQRLETFWAEWLCLTATDHTPCSCLKNWIIPFSSLNRSGFLCLGWVLFRPSFSSVSSLHTLNSSLHRKLYSFYYLFSPKFSNSPSSFMRQRLRQKLTLSLRYDSIICIMLFSGLFSSALLVCPCYSLPFWQLNVVKQMSLEECPKFSLVSKTKPAKFGSDHCLSTLRTVFPQSITLHLSRVNFIFHFITYSTWWKLLKFCSLL